MAADSSRNAGWFLAGLSIGAALAVVLAPASGQDTRRYLRDKTRGSGKDILNTGRELFDMGRELADEAAGMFEEGRKLMEDYDRTSAVPE